MPTAVSPSRSKIRLRTVLGGVALTVLAASAIALPSVLAQSTTARLDQLAAAEEVELAEPTEEVVAAPLPDPNAAGLVALAAAFTQVGKAYEWGGTGPDTWDCSGLVQWAFAQAGVELPRLSEEQALVGDQIPVDEMVPGDVITFRDAADHVGIYAGDAQVLNAYDQTRPIGLTPLVDLPPINNVRRF